MPQKVHTISWGIHHYAKCSSLRNKKRVVNELRFAEHEAGRTGHLAVRFEGKMETIAAGLPEHIHERAVALRGWHLDLPTHIFYGLLLCIIIIGIPWGKMHFRLAKLALSPFGMEVV